MNSILLKTKYKKLIPYLQIGFKALETNNYKMPIQIWLKELQEASRR